MSAGFAALDPQNRAGVLSRAALAIDSGGVNPDAAPVLPDELTMREDLVREFVSSLKIRSEGTEDPHEIESKILDWLDAEAERLSGPHDTAGAITRLSSQGALPSDVYEVVFSLESLKAIADLGIDDRHLVSETVRAPDMEEQFGSGGNDDQPKLVSLFGKWFALGRERDRFLLVVTGQRSEKTFTVQYFFRVYEHDIQLHGVTELHHVLERFAGVYGLEFEIGDWRGKYLFHRKVQIDGSGLTFRFPQSLNARTFAGFTYLMRDGFADVALGIGVDMTKYKKDVTKHTRHETEHHHER